ncbi:MAG: PQQ-binding-like beta-propeller repeat protein [Planctomycetota bacterium]|nr:PQQ-binding-like beta-propeller repeat protein [Planctomycetota bacterium]
MSYSNSYQKGDSFSLRGEESRGSRIAGFLFVGLGKRVIALEKTTGREVWEWTCPRQFGQNVTMLIEDRQIFVSANGYLFCLDARNGRQMWENPLKGRGVGIASLATTAASNDAHALQAKRMVQAQQGNA